MNELLIALGIGAGAVIYQGHLPSDQPFYTLPPQQLSPTGLQIKAPFVSVCYGSKKQLASSVAQLVAAACENPKFLREDYTGNCTLDAPIRVTYSCTKVNKLVAAPRQPFQNFGDVNNYYRTVNRYRQVEEGLQNDDQ
jgi:hypothetical protein